MENRAFDVFPLNLLRLVLLRKIMEKSSLFLLLPLYTLQKTKTLIMDEKSSLGVK